jgi:hypothetical protein
VNYKIIKKYFNSKKKAKLFKILQINKKKSKELDKKSSLIKYIYISRNFINKIKKEIFINRNKIYNKKISKEFTTNLRKKKIFQILFKYYSFTVKFHKE